ncbi:MAG: selenocysteine-specific translation elongation factor [Tissierellia bacterium]|nr:selenocysteine-specific translation elongation factor [Tissierellia bacterium]
MNKNIIIATAGHIDHGKSTLIKALTGRETDTLQEEKDRGISINLGFTYFDLNDGKRAGIIDVPGHEKFVRNMMAGCVGVDLVLLVIAADDGVMPQTIEHADILHFMGVENAIIVITKTDNVEEEMIELVKEDVKTSFKNTILAQSPIICVDSVSGKNLDKLKELITQKCQDIRDNEDTFSTRMNIDRVFSIKGFGTVVTGTLIEGEIKKDKEYMLYPKRKLVKIRNIQNHGKDENVAKRGQRTALNLANIHKNEIDRGDIIASANSLQKASIIACNLQITDHTDLELKHWDRVRFFTGTHEVLARIVPLSKKTIRKNESALVELRLEEEIYLKRADKFVIRNYSPVFTIGGGKIIDISNSRHTINNTDYVKYLTEKSKFDVKDLILDYCYDFRTFDDIYMYLGKNKEYINKNINKLLRGNEIYKINNVFIGRDNLELIRDDLVTKLNDYHKEHPLEAGINKSEFKNLLPSLDHRSYEAFFENELINKKITTYNGFVKNANFKINTSNQDEDIKKIIKEIKDKKPELLKYKELVKSDKDKKIVNYLLKRDLIRIDDFIIEKEYMEEIKEKLTQYMKDKEEFSLAEFRDLMNISRKMATAILEHLDKIKFTKRIEDTRILL